MAKAGRRSSAGGAGPPRARPGRRRQRYLRTARRDPLSAKDARATDLVDPRLTPADYRALATDHLAHGRLDSALVDAFRAIVSDLDRRAVLGDVPGRTVTEIAAVTGRNFPDERDEIADAARWFDRAAYGHRSSAEGSAAAGIRSSPCSTWASGSPRPGRCTPTARAVLTPRRATWTTRTTRATRRRG